MLTPSLTLIMKIRTQNACSHKHLPPSSLKLLIIPNNINTEEEGGARGDLLCGLREVVKDRASGIQNKDGP